MNNVEPQLAGVMFIMLISACVILLVLKRLAVEPNRKKRNGQIVSEDKEMIDNLADYYFEMMKSGIDTPPARLEGSMAGNSYAIHSYTLQMIAYSQAVGRRANQAKEANDGQERKDTP